MPKTFPGNHDPGTPYHYDAYTFVNPFGPTCFEITLSTNTSGFFPFIQTYLGSFDPANIETNYLADPGFSADSGVPVTYSFLHLNAGETFVVVVNEVIPDGGVPDYSFTLTPAIPEPSTVIELCAGAALPGLWAWRRNVHSAVRRG